MLSREQAEAYGRKQRDIVGRSALAELKPRNFDPVQVLRQASKGRVARLLPVKFKLMSASPFAFYRGSVEIMAADLALTAHTGIEVQLCGDAHVKNFGFYATPGSDIILDINDFDQTTRGPWEWDVKRMTASIVLAGRDAGASAAKCRNAAGAFVDEYCAWMGRFARMPTMDMARHRTTRDPDDPVMRSALEKAERVTPLDSLHKLTHKTKSGRRFRFQPNVLWQVPKKISSMVIASLRQYRETLSPDRQMLFDRYRAAEVGFKVAGTGSVGTRDFVVLLFGRDMDDPLFLQVKEEPPQAYAPFLKDPSAPRHQGERAVRGQHALQVLSDPLLGWCSIEGHDYLVRQLNDHKSSIDPAQLNGRRLIVYSRVCGELLAKGHARTGDPVALSAYIGKSGKTERALLRFAMSYADQVEADFKVFRKAVKSGLLNESAASAI